MNKRSVVRCFVCNYPVSCPKLDHANPFNYRHHSCGDSYGQANPVISNPAAWIEEWCFELGIDIRDLL